MRMGGQRPNPSCSRASLTAISTKEIFARPNPEKGMAHSLREESIPSPDH